jgi:N6-adenosine-specific RNA methylase IME4
MSVATNFAELRAMRPFGGYRAFLADPAWRQEMRSTKGEGKSPQAKYLCMTPAEMAAMPVAEISAPGAAMFMWTTSPNLVQGIELLAAWGFEYKAAAAWAKESKLSGDTDSENSNHKFAFGTGYIFRSAAEFLLVGTRGTPVWNKVAGARSVRNLIYAPVREHSRKPDCQYGLVETLTIGPFIELFSRTRRRGWDSFGNEAETFEAA